jgi:ethanolamine utilization protein EutQ (cupin superfamily)
VLNANEPMGAADQKETFNNLVTEALGEDSSYETVKNIHENLNEVIAEKKKESSAPVMLDKTEVKEILEKSGVKEDKLEHFEEKFEMATGEDGKLAATNIVPARKFEVKTVDVVVKINPDKTDLVSTQIINGKQCLVIEIDERLEVNGISVNPETGEVIERD